MVPGIREAAFPCAEGRAGRAATCRRKHVRAAVQEVEADTPTRKDASRLEATAHLKRKRLPGSVHSPSALKAISLCGQSHMAGGDMEGARCRARASTSSPLTWKMGALSALATSVQYALERLLRGSVVKATCAGRPRASLCGGGHAPLTPREPQHRSIQVWHAALPRRHTLTKLRALLHVPRQRTRGRDPRAGRTGGRLGAGQPAACEARRSVRPRAGQGRVVAQAGRAPGGGAPGC
jgi:hypothetical protein